MVSANISLGETFFSVFYFKTFNFTFKCLVLFAEVMLLKNTYCIAWHKAGMVDYSLLPNLQLWKQQFALGTELLLPVKVFWRRPQPWISTMRLGGLTGPGNIAYSKATGILNAATAAESDEN